jgi:translation initiation factor 1
VITTDQRRARRDRRDGEFNHEDTKKREGVFSWFRGGYDLDMSDRGKGRLVYSTGIGSICPGCGWPSKDCKCSSRAAPAEVVPDRVVAKLRMEKKGRGGKTVTVVYDLPRNAAFLKDLCQELKKTCGTGGAVDDGAIELQGDLRDRVREVLTKKGFLVKG